MNKEKTGLGSTAGPVFAIGHEKCLNREEYR